MRTLDEISLSPNERRAIEEAARVLRASFPVERIVLFGSKARGGGDPESDIDLLVLTSREMSWDEKRDLIGAIYPLQLEHAVGRKANRSTDRRFALS